MFRVCVRRGRSERVWGGGGVHLGVLAGLPLRLPQLLDVGQHPLLGLGSQRRYRPLPEKTTHVSCAAEKVSILG